MQLVIWCNLKLRMHRRGGEEKREGSWALLALSFQRGEYKGK